METQQLFGKRRDKGGRAGNVNMLSSKRWTYFRKLMYSRVAGERKRKARQNVQLPFTLNPLFF